MMDNIRPIDANQFEVIGGIIPDGCDADSYLAGCKEIIDMIDNAPTLEYPKWISVEERLPEAYHTYLVAIKEKYTWENEWRRHVDVADLVYSGGYIEDRWNTCNDWDEGQEIHVTHWMPLPEPPKE